jgi:hypothetical protein
VAFNLPTVAEMAISTNVVFDWGHPEWGGNGKNIFTKFVEIDISATVGKLNATSFVRKVTKIDNKRIVDADTGASLYASDSTNIGYYSLKNYNILNFIESDLGDKYNNDDWCESEKFYTTLAEDHLIKNNQKI